MSNFKNIIEEYIEKNSLDENDARIINVAIKILDLEPVLEEKEIQVLNDLFQALREDYTLSIGINSNFNYQVIVEKQSIPEISNKHDVNCLYNKLISSVNEMSSAEKCVLNLFNACEHVEENEIIIVDTIVDYFGKNWTITPLNKVEKDGKMISATSTFKPLYNLRSFKVKKISN